MGKINSNDRCLINSYTMEIIAYLMDHDWDINDNAIDKIQDTLVDFYKTIKRMSFLKFDIDDAKEYLFDELNFRNSHQSKYYPRENVNSASDIFNILSDYYMISKDEDFYLDLIQYLRDNKKLNVWK